MDIEELERLVRLMNENGLVELEIEREGQTIRLRKAGTPAAAARATPSAPTAAPAPAPAAPGAPAAPAGPPPGVEEIRSPIVGTFYRSASPDTPPYVNPGDRITPDSV